MRALKNNKSVDITLRLGSELRDDCREVTINEFVAEYLPTLESCRLLSNRCGLNGSIFNKIYHNHQGGCTINFPNARTMSKIMDKIGVRIVS